MRDPLLTLSTSNSLYLGISLNNIKLVFDTWDEFLGSEDASKVLYEISMDETPCLDGYALQLEGEEQKKILIGACGDKHEKDRKHECFGKSYRIKYLEDIFKVVEEACCANNVSLIMLNPINNKKLPKLPIALLPTCMSFKKEDMIEMWDKLLKLLMQAHASYPRYRPCAFSSDGCKTRVTIQDNKCRLPNDVLRESVPHNKYFLPHPVIGYGGEILTKDLKVPVDLQTTQNDWIRIIVTGVVVVILMQQDPIHCVKKLANSIDSSARSRQIGSHAVDIAFIKEAIGVQADSVSLPKDIVENEADYKALERRDPMDLKQIQSLIKLKVQNRMAASDNDKAEINLATRLYMKVIWRMRMIYLGINVPLKERIKFCAFVIRFLFGWFNNVAEAPHLNHKDHFITMEAFRDCLICCCYFINIIRLTRDTSNGSELGLDLSGTQCCEDIFSAIGKWGILKAQVRNEIYADMLLTLRKLFRTELSGFKNKFSRNKNYSYEAQDMLDDERECGWMEVMEADLNEFDDKVIAEWLDKGVEEANTDLSSLGVSTDFSIDYSKVYFNTSCTSSEARQSNDAADLVDNEYEEVIGEEVQRALALYELAEAIPDVASNEVAHGNDGEGRKAAPQANEGDASKSKNAYLVKSREDPTIEQDVRIVLSSINNYLCSTTSKDRNVKIISAAVSSALKKKSHTKKPPSFPTVASSNMQTLRLNPIDSLEASLMINTFVAAIFLDGLAPEGVRFWIGRINSMINRPTSTKGIVMRKPISFANMPASLHLRCFWYVPIVDEENDSIYTTKRYRLDASQVGQDNAIEMQAKFIICLPVMHSLDGDYVIDDKYHEFIINYMDGIRAEKVAAKEVAAAKNRKRKAEEDTINNHYSNDAERIVAEEEKLTPDDRKVGSEVLGRASETAKQWFNCIILECNVGGNNEMYKVRWKTTSYAVDDVVSIRNLKRLPAERKKTKSRRLLDAY